MMSPFSGIGKTNLLALADAIERGKLRSPFSTFSLSRHSITIQSQAIANELTRLTVDGMKPEHIAYMLRLLSNEREEQMEIADEVELVWTSPSVTGATHRDTYVVASELLAGATQSILLSSYSLDVGEKSFRFLSPLARKLDGNPDFQVKFYLNIQRKFKDPRESAIILEEFAEQFKTKIWPGERLPVVYYDPRSLSKDFTERSCLHIKCIVIDDSTALVSSANFTEASRTRNIEGGLKVTSPHIVSGLRAQFDRLIDERYLVRLKLGEGL